MKKPLAVLFDYGGTLGVDTGFDLERGVEYIRQRALNSGVTTTVELSAAWKRLHADIEMSRRRGGECSFEVTLSGIFRCVFGMTGLRFSEDTDELEYLFDQANSDHAQTPYMAELLDYLKQENIRTGVISNIVMSGNALKRSLDTLYPDNAFEFVLTSADYILSKPAPYMFETACKRLGIAPGDCVYCGDSEHCDVQGALKAGIVPVLYRSDAAFETDYSENGALTVNSWSVLTALLKKG